MHQHVARALRAGAVAAVGLAAVDVDAVGVGHAHAQALRREHVRHQARGRRLAVGAGDRDDGDAAVLVRAAAVARAVDARDDGFADVAALAVGRAQVHAQPRRGVDLDDAAALLLERLVHALGHHVDAADMQADDGRRRDRARRDLGMHVIGHVGGGAAGGQVGVVAQDHAAALVGYRLGRQALQVQARDGDVVQADLRQRGRMAVAAARVLVDLVDQLAHRVHAVADHVGRIAAGRGHQLVADHQQAVIAAGQELLDHHGADLVGRLVGHLQMLAGGDVHRHALALVAVQRLDHDRQADLLRQLPGFVDRVHRRADRHRHAGRLQQALGQVLVLRDRFGHRAGGVDLGRPDAALLDAPAQLHQRALRQAAEGDAALAGGVDDGAGRGAEADVLVGLAQRLDGGVGVEGAAGLGRGDQLDGLVEGHAADVFLAVLDDDLVGARLGRGVGVAEGHRAAGLGLQRERGLLQHMGQRDGRLGAAGRPQRADAGEALAQAGLEAGHVGERALGLAAVHDRLDGGVAAPHVGAAEGAGAGDFHLSSFGSTVL